jgi:hypothetical protein
MKRWGGRRDHCRASKGRPLVKNIAVELVALTTGRKTRTPCDQGQRFPLRPEHPIINMTPRQGVVCGRPS